MSSAALWDDGGQEPCLGVRVRLFGLTDRADLNDACGYSRAFDDGYHEDEDEDLEPKFEIEIDGTGERVWMEPQNLWAYNAADIKKVSLRTKLPVDDVVRLLDRLVNIEFVNDTWEDDMEDVQVFVWAREEDCLY